MSTKFGLKEFYKHFKTCINASNDPDRLEILFHCPVDKAHASHMVNGNIRKYPDRYSKSILLEGISGLDQRFSGYWEEGAEKLFFDPINNKVPRFLEKYDTKDIVLNVKEPIQAFGILFFHAIMNDLYSRRRDNQVKDEKPVDTENLTTDWRIPWNPSSQVFSFYDACIPHGEIKRIRMAFHSGSYWGLSNKYIDLLTYFNEKEIPVEIMSNSFECIEDILVALRKKGRIYTPIPNDIKNWDYLAKEFTNITYKVCSKPFFRGYYYIEFVNGDEITLVMNYAYYSKSRSNDLQVPKRILYPGEIEFEAYKEEFEFLWNESIDGKKISISYDEYMNTECK